MSYETDVFLCSIGEKQKLYLSQFRPSFEDEQKRRDTAYRLHISIQRAGDPAQDSRGAVVLSNAEGLRFVMAVAWQLVGNNNTGKVRDPLPTDTIAHTLVRNLAALHTHDFNPTTVEDSQ